MNHIPRKKIGFFPTPLSELKRLSLKLNGPDLFIKRDDMTGLAFGGNKTRKLEYLIGDAISKGCDTIITGGAEQSNHCRQTAAASAMCGLECHLVLGGEEPELPTGNLLIDKLFDAKIHWTGEFRKGEKIPDIAEQLKSKGKKPYIVPYGGSNEIGTTGFVEAIRELTGQLAELKEKITHIIFASSSGGTHAGMMVGKNIYNLNARLIGIEIDKSSDDEIPFTDQVLMLANSTADSLNVKRNFGRDDLILVNNYLGDGYGVIGSLERNAIKLLAETEGILVDPVYTGRVFGALVDLIENKYFTREDKVLFWHTGGTPSLFHYAGDLI